MLQHGWVLHRGPPLLKQSHLRFCFIVSPFFWWQSLHPGQIEVFREWSSRPSTVRGMVSAQLFWVRASNPSSCASLILSWLLNCSFLIQNRGVIISTSQGYWKVPTRSHDMHGALLFFFFFNQTAGHSYLVAENREDMIVIWWANILFTDKASRGTSGTIIGDLDNMHSLCKW